MKSKSKKNKSPRFDCDYSVVIFKNEDILCERCIKPKQVDERVLTSLEIREVLQEIAGTDTDGFGGFGILPKFFKEKTRDHLWSYFRTWQVQTKEDIYHAEIKNDVFTVQLKMNDRVIGETTFDGDVIPAKVKYNIDLRDVMIDVVDVITRMYEQGTYDQEYMGYDLSKDVPDHVFLTENTWVVP